jgi:23S rRNA (uracil1939-C5)-methyltransferase
MLKSGDILELEIHDLAFGGDGVARHEQFVVFVPFTIPDERVRARIVTVKKNFATAQLDEVLLPSPHRVAPVCPHFGEKAQPLPCGGCQYQHLNYSAQLEIKAAQIRESLRRIGSIENPPVEPMIPSPRPFGYRNKITLHQRGAHIGYLASDNQTLLDVERCPLATESVNDALARERKSRHTAKRARSLTIRQTSAGATICDDESRGKSPSWVDEIVLGKKLKLPPASFFQVNAELTPMMIALAREMFAAGNCRALVDAYCGVGLFALLLAEDAKQVHGIESDALAVEAARFNAEKLGLTHCHFSRGKVESLLPKTLATLNPDETCVLLDPPRAGCESRVLETILEFRPQQIIYISCNPPALARDLKRLIAPTGSCSGASMKRRLIKNDYALNRIAATTFPSQESGGYTLRRVVPLDMFPQTAHCEVMALLERI